MDKKIEDYLHLYLGCKILRPDMRTVLTMSGISSGIIHFEETGKGETYGSASLAKPILRPLSDMTEEEAAKAGIGIVEFALEMFNRPFSPSQFHYLISKHFDLFGLIESGLAIDANTLKK